MKKIIFIVIVAVFLTACNSGNNSSEVAASQASERGNVITELTVSGMTCNNCVEAVTEAVSSLSGVTNVTVTLSTGNVLVEHSPEISTNTIETAIIEEAGYAIR